MSNQYRKLEDVFPVRDELPDGMSTDAVMDEITQAARMGIWNWWAARGEALGALNTPPTLPEGASWNGYPLSLSQIRVGVVPAVQPNDDSPAEALVLHFTGQFNGEGPVVRYTVSVHEDGVADVLEFIRAGAGLLKRNQPAEKEEA